MQVTLRVLTIMPSKSLFPEISKEELERLALNSTSMTHILSKLEINIHNGNNHRKLKALFELYGLTPPKPNYQGSKNRVRSKTNIQDYFDNKRLASSHDLKLRIIKEKILEHRCMGCLLEVWRDKPIPLELHHVDGNRKNNNLSNLQLLCPNCHAQTDNYRGAKNRIHQKPVPRKIVPWPDNNTLLAIIKKNGLLKTAIQFGVTRNGVINKLKSSNLEVPKEKKTRKKIYTNCILCGDETVKNKRCLKCSGLRTKSPLNTKGNWPEDSVLSTLLWEKPSLEVAKIIGVSDSRLSKYCKDRNIPKPGRGYWMK